MKEGAVFYEKIDSSLKKEKLDVYKSAKTWFAEEFKNSNYVLKMDDKELGELIAKGVSKLTVTFGGSDHIFWMEFTAKASCRKDKYRIQVYDIAIRSDDESEFTAIEAYLKNDDSFNQAVLHAADDETSHIIRSSWLAVRAKADTF